MTRGNWQKRVERVEARRKEAREDKLKQRHKRQQKQRVQELVRFLDRLLQNHASLERLLKKRNVEVVRIHLWTDSPTSAADVDDSESDDDDDVVGSSEAVFCNDNLPTSKPRSKSFGNKDGFEDSPSHRKSGRTRSKSIHEVSPAVGLYNQHVGNGNDNIHWDSKRNRSNSLSESNSFSGKRKSQPRHNLKELGVDSCLDAVHDNCPQLILSRSFFFWNKFEDTSRGLVRKNALISNRYSYAEPQATKSLCSVIVTNENYQQCTETLKQSEQAAELGLPKELASIEPGSMNMVYYSEIVLSKQFEMDGLFCHQFAEVIARKSFKYANVVYVVFMDILVFDRLRDGLLYETENGFWSYAMNDNKKFLVKNQYPEGNPSTKESHSLNSDADEYLSLRSITTNLPGVILTQILIFLPDSAVAAACRVCKTWNREIGQNSSHVWQYLLVRHCWPTTAASAGSDDVGREAFRRHYIALRDVNAIQSALRSITTKKRVKEKEMSYIDFSTGKNFPSYPNCCVGIRAWSPKRVLAAFALDCSLRLFESEKRYESDEIVCRELVCQRIDPYRNTKKRNCQIVSMVLDDDSIGCLCRVVAENVLAEAFILVALTREDFLLGEYGTSAGNNKVDESVLKVIDIGEAVLNYMISLDCGGYGLMEVNRFMMNDGDISEIDVTPSNSVIACGYGRFMVEVRITLPGDEHEVPFVERRLVLFSTRIGAIVWMGEESGNYLWNSLQTPWPSDIPVVLACRRRPQPGSGSRSSCSIAITTVVPSAISLLEISSAGVVQETCTINIDQTQAEGWVIASSTRRLLLISSHDIICADSFVRVVEDTVLERKANVSFFPRYQESGTPSYSTMTISANVDIMGMIGLRDDHMLLLCRRYVVVSMNNDQAPRGDNNLDVEELMQDEDSRVSLHGIIIHIPTRSEIGSVCLLEHLSSDINDIPLVTIDCDDTIGIGLSWKGIIMTGEDVRSVRSTGISVVLQNHSSQQSNKLKKKGVKPKKVQGKKDGFARGMSLRG